MHFKVEASQESRYLRTASGQLSAAAANFEEIAEGQLNQIDRDIFQSAARLLHTIETAVCWTGFRAQVDERLKSFQASYNERENVEERQ